MMHNNLYFCYSFTVDQAEHIAKLKTISAPNIPEFLKLHDDVKWRIDVTISTR